MYVTKLQELHWKTAHMNRISLGVMYVAILMKSAAANTKNVMTRSAISRRGTCIIKSIAIDIVTVHLVLPHRLNFDVYTIKSFAKK